MADAKTERTIADLVFVGLNRRVIALDRYDGSIIWSWKAPKGSGYVTLMLDGDRVMVCVNGYVYCLDPLYGQVVWDNPLKGYGHGIASFASVAGSSGGAAAERARQAAAAAAAVN